MEASTLASGTPVDTSSPPTDTLIGGIASPSQGLGGGLEKLAFERSTSSINNISQAQPQESSIAGSETEEQLQKELSKTRQQLKDLATRNQELSQRLSAVEQSVSAHELAPNIYSRECD